jgi:RNA polymerase-binding transcription factor DksA
MAKKAQKGKPVKKSAKPVKKALAKKVAAKKPAPKKKVVKPAKKVAAKKPAKPIKKAVAKKPVKKVVAKKPAKPVKKVVAKKPAKPVKKALAKKAVAKPVKKVVAKKVVKPIKKAVVKPVAKKATPAKTEVRKIVPPAKKEVVQKQVPVKSVPSSGKQTPPAVTKKKSQDDIWDDDDEKKMYKDEPMVVEYKTPTVAKPLGPTPTPHINTDSRTRYSDQELKEFKELILKKLEEATKDLELLRNTLSHKDDHGTDDTSPTFKLLEDGSDVLSKEETSHLANRQEKFIQNLQNALIRVENKTYGICRVTGKLISKERLRSVPHATLAIEAKLGQNN